MQSEYTSFVLVSSVTLQTIDMKWSDPAHDIWLASIIETIYCSPISMYSMIVYIIWLQFCTLAWLDWMHWDACVESIFERNIQYFSCFVLIYLIVYGLQVCNIDTYVHKHLISWAHCNQFDWIGANQTVYLSGIVQEIKSTNMCVVLHCIVYNKRKEVYNYLQIMVYQC